MSSVQSVLFAPPAPSYAPPPDSEVAYDPQQAAAIAHNGSAARLMAGAGTGKSSTIAGRTRRLLSEGVSPTSIIALTFTRKGAEELARKMQKVCGMAADSITIGTFHRIAAQEVIARQQSGSRWTVLDEDDADHLWHQSCEETAAELLPKVLKGVEIFTGTKTAHKETERRIKSLFNALREFRSFQVNMGRGTDSFCLFAEPRLIGRSASYRKLLQGHNRPDFKPFFTAALKRYEDLKQGHAAKDYDDLLVAWRDLLRTDIQYRAATQHRWTHVIIDEYQDTNILQEDIVSLLNVESLFVVGDVAQCIFAWRSAVPELMIGFRARYRAADFPLEFNYRSRDEIIEVANHVLRLHTEMLSASLSEDMEQPLLQLRGTRGAGGSVNFVPAHDQTHETEQIASAIDRLIRKGTNPADIAVLARVSNYTGAIETRLRGLTYQNATLPVQVWGGRSLLDSRSARDLLSLLKVLSRPTDPWPFMRVATLFPGIGDVAASTAFFRYQFRLPLKGETSRLEAVLDQLNQTARDPNLPAETRLVTLVNQAIDFMAIVYESDHKSDDFEKRSKRFELEALREGMCGSIADLQRRNPDKLALADLINAYSLDPARDRVIPGALTISTVHQAKGLEWKYVFVMGVSEGVLPVIRHYDKEEAPAETIANNQAALEEECRILYVAMTRAKDHLALSYTTEAGLSRFVKQIPALHNRCLERERHLPPPVFRQRR